jgi:hypothetical protein
MTSETLKHQKVLKTKKVQGKKTDELEINLNIEHGTKQRIKVQTKSVG